jgi:L-aspartate oxidase
LQEAQISDFLVIGSGIAGLNFALKVADHGSVHIVTKGQLDESNTSWAQGGIAAVMDAGDNFDAHIDDTLVAGAGLCHRDAVEATVQQAPDRIADLLNWGVQFTRHHDGSFDLAREGGHSHHRILHAADLTGAEIERVLVERARQHPNIRIYEHHTAVDLITEQQVLGNLQAAFNICFGAYVFSERQNCVVPFRAKFVLLASGGASRVYLHSTNPEIATGDGVAMAYRAGVRIANMEFVQFHPTALYNPGGRSFLISEALRGHGGRLIGADGRPFMTEYDGRAELAPRDIVARAIDAEMKKKRQECVYLDMTHFPADDLRERFPNIHRFCLDNLKLDITRQPIPVVPAAHYICGGVMTSLSGQTSMQNLFACGEVAHTGLHGANRLASNSLIEGLVFSHNAAMKVISKRHREFRDVIIPPWDESGIMDIAEWRLVRHNFLEIQNLMWDYVGIVRSTVQLNRANSRMWVIYQEVEDYYKRSKLSRGLIELRNMSAVAYLIIRSALWRRESRGLHYTSDYPDRSDKFLKDTIL